MISEHPAAVVPRSAPPASGRRLEQVLTGVIIFTPLAVLALVVARVHRPSLRDAVLAVVFYAVTGHGVTVGFHRLLAHKSYKAKRPLRNALAIAGSMSFEGPVIGWVADHRRHHAATDRADDPHSPYRYGEGPGALLRGVWHSHMGWLFEHNPTSQERYARDLLADEDLVRINRLFPLWCGLSLTLPFALGWTLGGDAGAGWSALLWAGAVRIAVLHQVTWSINSLCHILGRRPYDTDDRSTNVALLALPSMGEAWHNNHHAFPASARHGIDRWQVDTSAALIRLFSRFGWASEARYPAPDRRMARQPS
jgi:stearoyl-CoA desaturase (delta-9 desaturase)